jgi:hypothetical protein
MDQYRKKPIVIEAHHWDGTAKGATPLIDWVLLGGGTARYHSALAGFPYIAIDTVEGTMNALQDDWIIRGVKGEFYPCKPDIFEATYEAVPEEATV